MIEVLTTLILGTFTVLLAAMFPMAFCIAIIGLIITFIISFVSYCIETRAYDKFFESEVK